MSSGRRYLAALMVVAALAMVVNAAAFAYRWLAGTVTVAGATAARGAACTGFYSSAAQPGISPTYLPSAGTNYNAPTYGGNSISVTTGDVVCQWGTYYLYESITVSIPVTVGSWYVKDLYGFGYNGTATDPKVYVWLVVEKNLPSTAFASAYLVVYKGATKVAELDLLTSGARVGPIELSAKEGLRLDLRFDAYSTGTGTHDFRVGFYVSQSSESPA